MQGNDQISEESILQENAQQAKRQEIPVIRSVGIVSRPRRIDVDCVVPPLLDWLAQHGITAVLDRETAHTKSFEDVRDEILPIVVDAKVTAEAEN